jgi:hypothetical protein
MSIDDVLKRIKESKSIRHKGDRLYELRDIAEEIGNHFTESMSHLEDEIGFVLDRTSEKQKEELGWHEVSDVTSSINVISSWDH